MSDNRAELHQNRNGVVARGRPLSVTLNGTEIDMVGDIEFRIDSIASEIVASMQTQVNRIIAVDWGTPQGGSTATVTATVETRPMNELRPDESWVIRRFAENSYIEESYREREWRRMEQSLYGSWRDYVANPDSVIPDETTIRRAERNCSTRLDSLGRQRLNNRTMEYIMESVSKHIYRLPDECEIKIIHERYTNILRIHYRTQYLKKWDNWKEIETFSIETLNHYGISFQSFVNFILRQWNETHPIPSRKTRFWLVVVGDGNFELHREPIENKAVEINERAVALLESHLTPVQLHFWREKKEIPVVSQHDNQYLLLPKRNYNVVLNQKADGDKTQETYCLQPKDKDVPMADQLLTQLILLETNEDYFLSVANKGTSMMSFMAYGAQIVERPTMRWTQESE